jgi:glutathione peroxidase
MDEAKMDGIIADMKLIALAIAVLMFASAKALHAADAPTSQPAKSPLDFTVQDIDGKDYNLAQLKGKVVMIVNVASKCGYTPQYDGLEKLYEANKDKGFVIVGFPANNFKSQEPGTNEQIKEFCTSKYNVTFPMMSKISVKGDDKHPLYQLLTKDKGEVTWNFNKFLVGRDGKLIEHFDSKVKPDAPKLSDAINQALAAPATPAS